MFKQALMRSAKQALKALVRQRNTQVPRKLSSYRMQA